MKKIVVFAAMFATALTLAAQPSFARGRGDRRYDRDDHAAVGRSYRSRPHGYMRMDVRRRPYYWHDGWFHRPFGHRYIVVRPPIGAFVPWLPFGCVSVWIGASLYYIYDGVYYSAVPGSYGYMVVHPPIEAQAPPTTTAQPQTKAAAPIGVPRMTATKGQSAEQQAKDRYECHLWAVSQSGYDPTQGIAAPDSIRELYEQSMEACLESHGYVAADTTK